MSVVWRRPDEPIKYRVELSSSNLIGYYGLAKNIYPLLHSRAAAARHVRPAANQAVLTRM